MKKVIISVTNDLSTDQRVDKISNSLHNAGFSVLLVGRKFSNSPELANRKYAIYRFNTFFQKTFLFYMEYNIRLFFFLLLCKSDILLSNDLDTLCANFAVSKIRNKKLIYDSHELFTELPELLGRPVRKFIWSCVESFCLRRLNSIYTVSPSIANYYKNKYGVDMFVIYNFPLTRRVEQKSNNSEKKTIIYQGAVNKDRGINLMIEAMCYVNAKLYIVGEGDLLQDMRQYTHKLNLNNKIFFKGKVGFDELFEITQEADLGLSFEADTCLSYRYSLPNKIFDYINAEVPILVSDLPEFRRIIKCYKVGQILKSRDVKSVAKQINSLLSTSKKDWSSELLKAKKAYSWSIQENKIISFFK